MSTRFDAEVDFAWERFEARLGRELGSIGEDGLVFSIDDGDPASPMVVMVPCAGRIWAELSSNDSLDAEHQLDELQEAAAEALGWCSPDDGDDTVDYWCDVPAEEVAALVPLVVGTLRQVLRVPHPDFVMAVWSDDEDVEEEGDLTADDDGSGVPLVVGFPQSQDELVALLRSALADIFGGQHQPDADGDFPLPCGSVPMWLRPHPLEPMVTVFAFVACEVDDARQAEVELGILNARHDMWAFTFDDRAVNARYSLPAAPLLGPQLEWTLARLSDQLDAVAADTAKRVSGVLWLDARGGCGDGVEA